MKAQPEFKHFHTDGQAILIEDYLEVRPEREAEVRALADAGRLLIGPWYVMPDEFVVSGTMNLSDEALGIPVVDSSADSSADSSEASGEGSGAGAAGERAGGPTVGSAA